MRQVCRDEPRGTSPMPAVNAKLVNFCIKMVAGLECWRAGVGWLAPVVRPGPCQPGGTRHGAGDKHNRLACDGAPSLLMTKQGSESVSTPGRNQETGQDLQQECGGPVLSEAPDVDGERSFWSTGAGRRLCTRGDVATPHTKGFLAAGTQRPSWGHLPDAKGPTRSRSDSTSHSTLQGRVRAGRRDARWQLGQHFRTAPSGASG